MDILTVEFFERLLNVSGVCLWGITMLYLIRQKGRGLKGKLKGRKFSAVCQRSFDDEVFAQRLKQQTEDAFKKIHGAIKKERVLMIESIEYAAFNRIGEQRRNRNADRPRDLPFQVHQGGKDLSEKKPKDSYAEVIRLAGLGINTKKISQKTSIPKAEVEMIIRLRKKKQQSRKSQLA